MKAVGEISAQEAKKIIGLKSTAYREYLSARLLINSHLFQQAGIFMASCLEKEIKSYLLTSGLSVKWIHDLLPLHVKLNSLKPSISDCLNIEFLTVLSNIYKTRYYDQLDAGCNFVFIKNKFLAELDYCFSIMEPTIRVQPKRDIEIQKTKYQTDIETKNPILFGNNYLHNNIDKDIFLSQPDLVYEFRIASNYEIFEVKYPIPYNRLEEKNKFLYEGLNQKSNNQFQASHSGYSEEELRKLDRIMGRT